MFQQGLETSAFAEGTGGSIAHHAGRFLQAELAPKGQFSKVTRTQPNIWDYNFELGFMGLNCVLMGFNRVCTIGLMCCIVLLSRLIGKIIEFAWEISNCCIQK